MMAQDSSTIGPPEDLRAFLLGTLPADDAERIEQRLVADEDFFQEVIAAEDEILDDMAAGLLNPSDTARLRQRWGHKPELAQRLRLRQAFFRALEENAPAHPPVRRGARWLIPVLAAAACLIAAAAFWMRRPAAPEPVFFPAFLARGAAPAPPRTLALAPPRLLALQFQTSGAGRWDLVITNRAGFLLRYTGLRAQTAGHVTYVTIRLDTATLAPGLYSAVLRPAAASAASPPHRWTLLVQ